LLRTFKYLCFIKFFKKYHKWLGIIATVFLLNFSISGIILGHRNFFSPIDISRKYMPDIYSYHNWDNASVRGAIKISEDSILLYGNMGVWLTDSNYSSYQDFSKGYKKGIDHKKICKIFKTSKGVLLSGSLFGLHYYNTNLKEWTEIKLPSIHNPRIVDILEKDDSLFLLTRSFLLTTKDFKKFEIRQLPNPENYDQKVGLFKTFWLMHSGEAYGLAGVLFVDFIGLVLIFLSLTGLFFFINKIKIKKKQENPVLIKQIKKRNLWYLKWHNKFGWIFAIFLVIVTFTGMFLRPPLLIPIASSKVGKLPLSTLDSDNAWYDQLRRITYDSIQDRFVIATLNAVYYSDDNLKSPLKRYKNQPPISVMGYNVFEQKDSSNILVGSFLGLFMWNTKTGYITDCIKKERYTLPTSLGSPVGDYMITGFLPDFKGDTILFDYDKGAFSLNKDCNFPLMPLTIKDTPMSLWNMSVEYHTGRILEALIGPFYILIVPLIGLFTLFILFFGIIVWWKLYRKQKY